MKEILEECKKTWETWEKSETMERNWVMMKYENFE